MSQQISCWLTRDLLTTYEATAVVTCNTGYELRGDGLLLCKSDMYGMPYHPVTSKEMQTKK